ncbi:hypothetical protein RchiOBHm_Chr5g0039701 [Rosa chinensis]|uniref:Uncharacterized protein n=1 Tax=Rosa chinensis TaxID=74649 RepID=A0A2P6QCC1_ROSCH|nr:hypothetical protein RchiOBHm_Chr5g0039701 [Rosa chinensis]
MQKYDADPAAKIAGATVLGIQVGCGLHSGDESRANVAQDNELVHQNPQAYATQDGNWIARIAA